MNLFPLVIDRNLITTIIGGIDFLDEFYKVCAVSP